MPVSRRQAVQVLGCATLDGLAVQLGLCDKADPLAGAEPYCFVDSSKVHHQLYVLGTSGPPILFLHELPGLVKEDLDAAGRLAAAGYRVIAPLFFGKPGRSFSRRTTTVNSLRVCGDDEFACGASRETSPHVAWLRELLGDLPTQFPGGRGVTVLGMCLTGAFPIALLHPPVVAAVVCQPTIPINLFSRFGWFTDEAGLGMADEDLKRALSESTAPVLGIRYTRDWRCPPERFARLSREFGERFFRLDLEGNGHSTLALDCRSEALDEVAAFVNKYARSEPDPNIAPFPLRSRANSPGPVLVTRPSACTMVHHEKAR